MEQFSCLAVDMGAGSIRVIQGIVGETFHLKEIHRFENKIEHMNGADRWDLDKITRGIYFGIVKTHYTTDIPVLSIGVDSWGVDFVLIGKYRMPLENPVSYRDERTNGMKEKWNTAMPELETFQRTGINYNVFNSLYQLLSLKGSNLLKKTIRIFFMADYINFYLGGKAANELTLSSTTQMLNCKTSKWDKKIIDQLGIVRNRLTTPVLPGTELGFFKDRLLSSFCPKIIAVAGHDTACAVAAIPFETDNAAFLSTGTWCIFGMLSDEPFLSEEAFHLGITNERSANGKFRPLKNQMGLWLIQQLRVAFGSKHTYTEIDEMAAACSASEYLIDPSAVLFYNPDNMKTAFDEYFNLNNWPKPETEAAYYRCAYDSLAQSFKITMQKFEKLRGKPFDVVHLIGGGVNSKLLCRLTANALQKKVVAGPVEAAVMGNLMIQFEALGKFSANAELKKMIVDSMDIVTYLPD